MRLDRNVNKDGRGKYALLKLRRLNELIGPETKLVAFQVGAIEDALRTLRHCGLLHFGDEGPGEQFFVMKYKDRFARAGLLAYAMEAHELALLLKDEGLYNFAVDVMQESDKASRFGKRIPD